LRKTAETEISDLTFWLRFGSVRVFINRNRTEIRFPHIPNPTVMARYSLFVLKVPLNPKQTNKETSKDDAVWIKHCVTMEFNRTRPVGHLRKT